MTEVWPCTMCGADTTRGSLLFMSGEWVAIPLCSLHRNAVADRVGPETIVIDNKRPN